MSITDNLECVDKQMKLELFVDTATRTQPNPKPRLGRRARNKQKRNQQKQLPQPGGWWNIWTIQDTTTKPDELGDLQPEVEVGDHSLFTRATEPHNPQHVAGILKHVSIRSDLSDDQWERVCNLLTEFADCFALSVREVLPIPGAEHHIHIPPDAMFLKENSIPKTAHGSTARIPQ
jgi:hypothetical protein